MYHLDDNPTNTKKQHIISLKHNLVLLQSYISLKLKHYDQC